MNDDQHKRGRRHGRVLVFVTGTGTAAQVVGPSTERVALLFSPPSNGKEYSLSTEADVQLGQGLVLVGGGSPVEITLERHGDAVRKPWFAISTNGVAAGVLEVTED